MEDQNSNLYLVQNSPRSNLLGVNHEAHNEAQQLHPHQDLAWQLNQPSIVYVSPKTDTSWMEVEPFVTATQVDFSWAFEEASFSLVGFATNNTYGVPHITSLAVDYRCWHGFLGGS
jgi:hypothetical protein